MFGDPAHRKRTAVDEHHYSGLSGLHDGFNKIFLLACEVKTGDVVAFPVGGLHAVCSIARVFAHHDNRRISLLGGLNCLCKAFLAATDDLASFSVNDSCRGRNFFQDPLEHCCQMLRNHLGRIIAELVQAIVCIRADHSDRAEVFLERQHVPFVL